MRKTIYPFAAFIFSALLLSAIPGCSGGGSKTAENDSLAIRQELRPSPVLSPSDAIEKMHVEDGFEVKLVAAEPLITAPIAMTFDDKGRIWVLDMQDYMPDTAGTGEDQPTGKVVILSDTNKDGVMDQSKIFLDSLVLPRAICLIENGILVAEPPKLWYYKIEDDRPVNKTLVDSAYAVGGNVEHQPNGLYRAMDNWIYNAKSAKRYRKTTSGWKIERTHFRGQWGITEDEDGRLYYNTNSDNLLGDYFSPGLGADNKDQRDVEGFVQTIVEDTRVFPIHPTPGVNRGYMEGILDDSLRLVNFTAACGPVIYQGNLLGQSYLGNAFIAEPSANLIKRDVLQEKGYVTTGEEAYHGREFLASEDERFRPVNLFNGPDGALYIVDMYRGIIQHKTYLTPYLKNEIKDRELTKPLNCGRIYKVIPKGANPNAVQFPAGPASLVSLLKHPNGWVRGEAQQLLVDAHAKSITPQLEQILVDSTQPVFAERALWTLEGLGTLQVDDVMNFLKQSNWPLRMQGLYVLHSVMTSSNYQLFLPVLTGLIDDTLAAPYIGFIANDVRRFDQGAADQLITELIKKYPFNPYVSDAVISNLQNRETAFYKRVMQISPDTTTTISRRLRKVMDDIVKAKNSSNQRKLAKMFPKGAALFQSVCQTCHGTDGDGVYGLAPPLNGSDWVQGDKKRLIPIVLYGLSGPVKVAGKLYTAPEVNGEMPGIGSNHEYTDDDIAQVLSLIRQSWNNKAPTVSAADVAGTRKKYSDRQSPFSMQELQQLH